MGNSTRGAEIAWHDSESPFISQEKFHFRALTYTLPLD